MPFPTKTRSEEVQSRERRLRSLLANRGELKFTSVDVKTYHPRSSENSSMRRAPLVKTVRDNEKSVKKGPTEHEKDAKNHELHGTRRLKAILKDQAKSKCDKVPGNQAASKATPIKGSSTTLPVNRQAQGRFAFLRNIKPSKLDYALQCAKPIDAKPVVTTSQNAEHVVRHGGIMQPNKALHMRETQWGRGIKTKSLAAASSPSSSKDIDIDTIVRSVRRPNHRRDPFRLVSLMITSVSVFLVLVIALCASIQIALMVSLVPVMDRTIEIMLRKLFGRGSHRETEDDSTSRDFLEKLICEVEARTKAKIGKRRLMMNVPYMKS